MSVCTYIFMCICIPTLALYQLAEWRNKNLINCIKNAELLKTFRQSNGAVYSPPLPILFNFILPDLWTAPLRFASLDGIVKCGIISRLLFQLSILNTLPGWVFVLCFILCVFGSGVRLPLAVSLVIWALSKISPFTLFWFGQFAGCSAISISVGGCRGGCLIYGCTSGHLDAHLASFTLCWLSIS